MSYSPIMPDGVVPVAPLRARPTLSIVVPCFNEEAVLHTLLARLARLSEDLLASGRIAEPAEIILVDDGSGDATWEIITSAHRAGPVTGIRLSRNHGHQRALLAGLMQARADVVVSMDADLQDDPDVVADMIDAYRKGAEIVYGVRASRASDSRFKRWTARGYYRLLAMLGTELIPDHADFRLMSRRALAALSGFEETNLFLRGLVREIGFASCTVHYDRTSRTAGESKYSLAKMLALAFEGITSFSVRPLRIIALVGCIIAALAFIMAGYSLFAWAAGKTLSGWTSVVVPMYLLGGLHLIALGVIGEYVGKIYHETKRRPRFILDEVRPSQRKFHEVAPQVQVSDVLPAPSKVA